MLVIRILTLSSHAKVPVAVRDKRQVISALCPARGKTKVSARVIDEETWRLSNGIVKDRLNP